jgi:hypothetical protein
MVGGIDRQHRWVMALRWTARIWSGASIALVLAFIVGEGFHPSGLNEWLGVLFFPIGISVGMILAWWKESLPKSARKNRSGGAGAIFCAQLRRAVAFSKYSVESGTAPCVKCGSLGRRRGEGYSLATLKEKTRKSSGRTCGGCKGDEVFAGAIR